MRLAFVGPLALPSLSQFNEGLQSVHVDSSFEAAAAIVQQMIGEGHHVTAITFSSEASHPLMVHGDQLSYAILPYHPHGARNLFLRNSSAVKEALLWANVEFVFANWSYDYGLGTVLSKIPHIITIHDAPWIVFRYLPSKHFWLLRCLLSTFVIARARHLVCVSPYIKSYLSRIHRRPANVIPNPLPAYLLSEEPSGPRPDHDRPIRFVSLLTDAGKRKNPKPMILGFRDLIRSGAKAELHLYGSDLNESSPLYHWAVEQEATEGIHFNGKIAHDQLMGLLRDSADVLVHPSMEESFGLTIAEAMAFGVPVIAGENSGAVSWVGAKGKAGIFIDVNQPAAFTQAMKCLAESSELRQVLGSEGFSYAHEEFDAKKVTKCYLELATSDLNHQPIKPTPWD